MQKLVQTGPFHMDQGDKPGIVSYHQPGNISQSCKNDVVSDNFHKDRKMFSAGSTLLLVASLACVSGFAIDLEGELLVEQYYRVAPKNVPIFKKI